MDLNTFCRIMLLISLSLAAYIGTQYLITGDDVHCHNLLPHIWNSAGFIIHELGYPTQDVADSFFFGLGTVGTVLTLQRLFDPRLGIFRTLGCTLQTQEHHGPGEDITWEAWTQGRLCSVSEAQMLATQGMDRYRQSIESDRCYKVCFPNVSSDPSRTHAFVTSAPAGQWPGEDYCTGGEHRGQCPQNRETGTSSPALSFAEGKGYPHLLWL